MIGFEVKSARGILQAASLAGDMGAVGGLRLLHAWVCHALEDLSLETEEHAMTPHAWFSGISVEWPVGSKHDALRHLAALHYQVHLIEVQDVPNFCQFAGMECPVCLEPWSDMAPKATAVALRCGHACCESCLDKCGVFAGSCLVCPVCREPAAATRTACEPG